VGKELATMSDEAIDLVNVALDKRLNKVKNKETKSCVLLEKYQVLVEKHAATQLIQNPQSVSSMVHGRRQTLGELTSALNRVKVGNWIEVEPNYSTGFCEAGGIGCVTNAIDVWSDTPSTIECPATMLLDVHYLLTNTRENMLTSPA
jgi:hypothetical protein